MDRSFHSRNRAAITGAMKPASLCLIFSGEEVRKTNDEYYPFFADRSFVYLTGIEQKQSVLLIAKDAGGAFIERLYMLPPDLMAERWTGTRLKPYEAEALSGVSDVRPLTGLNDDLHRLATSGDYAHVYLDLYRTSSADRDRPAQTYLKLFQREYPFISVENANVIIRKNRLIKTPEEIEALRIAEKITCEGILRMMKASRPGMFEYQYRAEFDYALLQHAPCGPGFPSIISAGKNNFCIHYYANSGQAQDGDMILNDVGAQHDGHISDVSRGWPCNGRYSERQRRLYECALATSNHMFEIIRPGMLMADVDKTIRSYNAERLKDAGVLKDVKDIGTYMWHGGAHHIGYDVHDVVAMPERVAPGMVFCVDVGIYHEEWGIGFRLEDNCLVTEDGCENLSTVTPRTIEDIEAVMVKR